MPQPLPGVSEDRPVAPSELSGGWGIGPGVSFALRTYPRPKSAIAFAIESQRLAYGLLPSAGVLLRLV